MEERKFKTGEVVQLISGSIPMTVYNYEIENGKNYGNVVCYFWHDSNQEFVHTTLHESLLRYS